MTDSPARVLIVGAGPTGLMLACELARYQIPFRLIDKNPRPLATSNATWIQTRTLEIFDEIGILDRFLTLGHKCTRVNAYSYGELLTQVNFDTLDSLYRFVLQLPQSETENILSERLNELQHQIERASELVTLSVDEHRVHAVIGHPDGTIESLSCDWLIACDGANSQVREKTRVSFTGYDIPQTFVVADVEMRTAFYPNEINIFFDAGTVLTSLPLGGDQFRINTNLHTQEEQYGFTEARFKKMVYERTYHKASISSISSRSPYIIHNRLLKNMRHRAIFFAGDAAHVHASAGGQGMNLGIQDAYNLAWKLAMVIKGKAHPDLLDSYHMERYPIVKTIFDLVQHITRGALIENFLLIDIRNFIIRLFTKPFFSPAKFGARISQLEMDYQHSPLIDDSGIVSSDSPVAGQHAPDVVIDHTTCLNHYLRNTCYNILLFTGEAHKATHIQLEEMGKLQKWLEKTYPDLVKTHVVALTKSPFLDNFIIDVDGLIHKRYHIETPAIYIIRPDHYIAYCSVEFKKEAIQDFISNKILLGAVETA